MHDSAEVAALTADDFFLPQHRAFFEAIKKLSDAGKPIDELLLRAELKAGNGWELIGGVVGFSKIINAAPNYAHIRHYADLVHDKARERQHHQFILEIADHVARRMPWQDVLGLAEQHVQEMRDEQPAGQRFQMLAPTELAKLSDRVPYIVPNVLAEGQPYLVAGGSKVLKTTVLCDLVLSCALGGSWLGYFRVSKRVRPWFLSGESGDATIVETFRRIAHAAGYGELERLDGFYYGSTLPQLSDARDVAELGRVIAREGIGLLILDPAMLCMDLGGREGSLFAVGRMLRNITEACAKSGCTLVIAHHTSQAIAKTKNYSPPTLNDASWAGFEQSCRQWILLNRWEEYRSGSGEHRLHLVTGGSAGHGAAYHLDVNEGTAGDRSERFWEVTVTPAGDAQAQESERKIAAAAQREQVRRHEHMQRRLEALSQCPHGETRRRLGELAGMNSSNLSETIRAALANHTIEFCEVKKHNGMHEGYRLKGGKCDKRD